MNEFEYAAKIIVHLLEKTEMNEKDNRELILKYFNNDQIRNIVETFAEEANLELYHNVYDDYICVIPKTPRGIFSYNKTDIYEKYKLDKESYELFVYFTFVIFYLFFDLNEDNFKVEKLMQASNEKIEKIKSDLEEIDINEKYNWNFNGILKSWEKFKDAPGTEITKLRANIKSKTGILKKTLNILHEEKIIEFIQGSIFAVKKTKKTEAVLTALKKDETFEMLKKYYKGEENAED